MLTLVGRSLRRSVALLAGVIAVLSAFQFLLVAVAASYERAGSFGALAALVPDFAQGHLGAALTSFAAMTTTGYFEPAVVMLIAQFAIHMGAEPAAEIEAGLADLVLARPVPRHRLVTRTLIVLVVTMLLAGAAMGLSTWLGLHLLAPPGTPWPAPRIVLELMANLLMLSWCMGALTLAAAGWARRRAAAQGPLALATIGFFLLEFLAGWWDPIKPVARLTPFHYFSGAAILSGKGHTAFNLGVLGAGTVAAAVVAYWRFEQRDV